MHSRFCCTVSSRYNHPSHVSINLVRQLVRRAPVSNQSRAAPLLRQSLAAQSIDCTFIWQQYQYHRYRNLCPACQVDECLSSSNPNAANSPYRAVAAAAASKQKRSYATIQREESYGQAPPTKKQMLDSHQALKTPPRQPNTQLSAEGRVFTRKSNSSQQSVFERKLVAAREKERPAHQTVTKAEKTSEENLESIKAWQKHTKRSFPKFVFYFESGSEDARHRCNKQVTALGAVSLLEVISSHSSPMLMLPSAKKNSSQMQSHTLSQLGLYLPNSAALQQKRSLPLLMTLNHRTASLKRSIHRC